MIASISQILGSFSTGAMGLFPMTGLPHYLVDVTFLMDISDTLTGATNNIW